MYEGRGPGVVLRRDDDRHVVFEMDDEQEGKAGLFAAQLNHESYPTLGLEGVGHPGAHA